MKETFKVYKETRMVDNVVIEEKIYIHDNTVPAGGIPRSISFHPSRKEELIKLLTTSV